MSKQNSPYRPLGGRWRFGRSRNAWLASDHLLLIKDQFFQEHYARLYWADIQTMLLYSLQRPRGFLLAFEVLCVLAAIAATFANPFGRLIAIFFVAGYLFWRFTRPNWACRIATRIGQHRFPLTNTLAFSRRLFEELKTRAASAQSTMAGMESAQASDVTLPLLIDGSKRKKRNFRLHVVLFGIGLFADMSVFVAIPYYVALVVVYFVQQDFEFPFAVRAATVMSQILAGLEAVAWLIQARLWGFLPALHIPSNAYWAFQILRILFSLFGIAAIYQQAIEHARYQPKNATVLGLS